MSRPSFLWIATAVVAATLLTCGAYVLHALRPDAQVNEPTAALVRASGKCAQCHREQTPAIVHAYERSAHAEQEVNCLECHGPVAGQDELTHRGFVLAEDLTSKNCAQCHRTVYAQYLRSRHAAPAWAAVAGRDAFTEAQIASAERFHPQTVDRPANALAQKEGSAFSRGGCEACHSVGRPNPDGSIGDCTDCHSRHWASLELAREPDTCGQCHMGPDHAQLEIYEASKHGVIFQAQKEHMDLSVPVDDIQVEDTPVPTCSTCHMGGFGELGSSHDTSPRLSYYLYAPISEPRPNHERNEMNMKSVCLRCHTSAEVDRYYARAEAVLDKTNEEVRAVQALYEQLQQEGVVTDAPYDEPMDLEYFDLWHYHGRTAKHGAYMGGADFVQWHGAYPLMKSRIEFEERARQLREEAQ